MLNGIKLKNLLNYFAPPKDKNKVVLVVKNSNSTIEGFLVFDNTNLQNDLKLNSQIKKYLDENIYAMKLASDGSFRIYLEYSDDLDLTTEFNFNDDDGIEEKTDDINKLRVNMIKQLDLNKYNNIFLEKFKKYFDGNVLTNFYKDESCIFVEIKINNKILYKDNLNYLDLTVGDVDEWIINCESFVLNKIEFIFKQTSEKEMEINKIIRRFLVESNKLNNPVVAIKSIVLDSKLDYLNSKIIIEGKRLTFEDNYQIIFSEKIDFDYDFFNFNINFNNNDLFSSVNKFIVIFNNIH